jgi:hypothetical protein
LWIQSGISALLNTRTVEKMSVSFYAVETGKGGDVCESTQIAVDG